MSARSIYRVECLCGNKITTHNRVTVCKVCLRLIVVEWGGEQIIVTPEDAVFLVASTAAEIASAENSQQAKGATA